MYETFEANPDIEMLMDHKYYESVKVKSIEIKKIEINNDTYIKNGKVLEMPPHRISVVIEITDTKGNKTELLGGQSLSPGDYSCKVQEDTANQRQSSYFE